MAARGVPALQSGLRGRRRRLLVLAIALGWLLLALAIAPASALALAREPLAPASLTQNTPQVTPCPTNTPITPIVPPLSPTPCPANTPPATATSAAGTATPAAATVTPKSTATNPPPPQSGGGPPPSTGGNTGPQPTTVVLAQPTLGDAAVGGVSGSSSANLASNGIIIFSTLGCVIGVIGLIGLVIAWITLVSDGWGPMLKAMLLGNRRGKRRFKRQPRTESRGGAITRRGGQARQGAQAAYRDWADWR